MCSGKCLEPNKMKPTSENCMQVSGKSARKFSPFPSMSPFIYDPGLCILPNWGMLCMACERLLKQGANILMELYKRILIWGSHRGLQMVNIRLSLSQKMMPWLGLHLTGSSTCFSLCQGDHQVRRIAPCRCPGLRNFAQNGHMSKRSMQKRGAMKIMWMSRVVISHMASHQCEVNSGSALCALKSGT